MAAEITHQRPKVLSIPSGVAFLPTLVSAVLDSRLGLAPPADERDLSALTIYVPTRRAARALAHAFAETVRPRALLLPRILPLGDPFDLDERAILASLNASGDRSLIQPAISPLDRRLRLAALVDGLHRADAFRDLAAQADGFTLGERFQDSLRLAGDLAALIDDGHVESVDWSKLKTAPLEGHDRYFEISLEFLRIVTEYWPEVLKAEDMVDPAERLNHLLRAEARRLRDQKPDDPIIVAGSTGTVPATADLMAAIARLPQGAIILPGLDQETDEPGWDAIAEDQEQEGLQPGHPQGALKRLLGVLGIKRADVERLGSIDLPTFARAKVVEAAHRAADSTEDWPKLRNDLAGDIEAGLKDVAVLEAPDERLEALAIAILLRDTLREENKTAAVITPDRALAARITSELRRWGIVADDSAGRPLAEMPLAVLAELALRWPLQPGSNALASALLSHPDLNALIQNRADVAGCSAVQLLQVIELVALRSGSAMALISDLPALVAQGSTLIGERHAARPQKRIAPELVAPAIAAAEDLAAALAPLADEREQQPVPVWAQRHQTALEALAGERAGIGADALALQALLDELATMRTGTPISLADYAALFDMLLREAQVPPPNPVQGRIKIWGLLEARLLTADHVILAGLNEGTWPPDSRTDAFLNRSLRRHLGLSPPERRLGQTAHDFVQAMAAPRVTLSRAVQVEGSPTIASRFLRRLYAFSGKAQMQAMQSRTVDVLAYAAALDGMPGSQPAALRPSPKPDADLHPARLSITEIRTLYRDPYAIYARHVLKLDPLPSLDPTLDNRDRGTLVHKAMADFIASIGKDWPEDALDRILAIGEDVFKPFEREERVQTFWKPVFDKVARWFVEMEEERWPGIQQAFTEKGARMEMAMPDGQAFALTGQIDRIDIVRDSTLRIADYKTGAAPSAKQVGKGNEPQLTLSAALAAHGAVKGVPPTSVSGLEYVTLGREPERKIIELDQPIDDVAAHHLEQLKTVLFRLRSGEAAYLSRRMPFKQNESGDYDHLARAAEWSQTAEDE